MRSMYKKECVRGLALAIQVSQNLTINQGFAFPALAAQAERQQPFFHEEGANAASPAQVAPR
eukprot:1712625-Prymnesium_polylepis.1